MPLISGKVAVPAGTESANVIEGSPFEFIAGASRVRLLAVGSGDDVNCVFQLGGATLIQGGLIPFDSSTDAQQVNDLYHWLIDALGLPGQRLYMTFRNEDSSARTVRYVIRIDAVG